MISHKYRKYNIFHLPMRNLTKSGGKRVMARQGSGASSYFAHAAANALPAARFTRCYRSRSTVVRFCATSAGPRLHRALDINIQRIYTRTFRPSMCRIVFKGVVFEWDDDKKASNPGKHAGVTFE